MTTAPAKRPAARPDRPSAGAAEPRLLSDLVRIRSRFTRSVHLERDLTDAAASAAVPGYVVTESAATALRAVEEALQVPESRALTLIGPYGSGKSAFCVYLTRRFSGNAEGGDRLLCVPVVGSRRPLGPALLAGLERAARRAGGEALHRKITTGALRSTFDALTRGKPITPRHLADSFVTASALLAEEGHGGILLLLDEAGKFLEFAAQSPQDSDIFALQELAEAAVRSPAGAPLIALTVLHQNLDAYARLLSRREQAEWSKVAERFRQIPFFPSDRERIDLVGRALQTEADGRDSSKARDGSKPAAMEWRVRVASAVRAECARYVALCQERRGGAPLLASPEKLAEWATAAYPLHPVALLALPALFRRAGQSHRSLFAFLSGEEPDALGRFLRETPAPEAAGTDGELPFYRLDRLSDYAAFTLLPGSGGAAAAGGGAARAWAEARETIERVEGIVSCTALRVLKCIGLLNLLKEDARLPATPEMVCLALGLSEKAATAAFEELQRRGLIAFRRTRGVWKITEGGDLDIDAEIAAARIGLSETSAALFAAKRLCPPALRIARRHSHRTGTLRAARVVPCDATELASMVAAAKASGDLSIFLCAVPSLADAAEAEATARLTGSDAPNVLTVISVETDALREAALELTAADRVERETPALGEDRAARRELHARRAEAESAFRAEWDRLFAPSVTAANAARFVYRGETIADPVTRFGRSGWEGTFLSEMADATYPDSPLIRNELINRRSLSSSAAAARRTLLEAILDPARVALEDFGFQGYPPERCLYISLLKAAGLHVAAHTPAGEWHLRPPDPNADPARLAPAWRTLERLIFHPSEGSIPAPIPVPVLFAALAAPPLGVTEGVAPVLLAVFLRVHDAETTFYREGTFVPEPGIADFEVLVRRPEMFALAGCRVSGARAAVVGRLAKGLKTEAAVVPVVRGLLRMVRSLEEYAWKTRDVPEVVSAVRTAFERARSPEQLLFADLPMALGLEPIPAQAGRDGDDAPPYAVDAFFEALNGTIRQWSAAFPNLERRCRDMLLDACGLPTGEVGWSQLREGAASLLEKRGFLPPALIPLLRRAVLPGDLRTSVDTVLSQVGSRSLRTWGDADAVRFAEQAAALGALYREAVAEASAFTAPALVPAEVAQREDITTALRAVLPASAPPRVVRAALLDLLHSFGAAADGDAPPSPAP